jgi:predicted phosphoribosyltransferase
MRTGYRDRVAAGEVLGRLLAHYAGRDDVSVLGLVRGGVPVAAVVAARLAAPLDVLVVRKLGVPGAEEVAFGALGPGGVLVRNEEIASQLSPAEMEQVRRREAAELARRERLYRAGRPALDLAGRTAIVVDDGLATGATARAAVAVARELGAATVVLAAPVAAPDALAHVRAVADEVVCPLAPAQFGAVSRYYQRFGQVSDDQVVALLAGGGGRRPARGTGW